MFGDTITVYNKYKGENGLERWQRTVLTGVFWNAVKGAVMRKTGALSSDSVQVIIPFLVQTSRKYKLPKEWTGLVDKSNFWTLQSGDTVIKGDIDHEIIKSAKELQSYDDIMVITSVDTKGFGGEMAHFDVSGK